MLKEAIALGIGIGTTIMAVKSSKDAKEQALLETHKPLKGDDICHICKNSCGNPIESKEGYGSRQGMLKHTFYCKKCGKYHTVWR